MKVGIPKTLAYYIYYPLWKGFFSSLDIELVVSQDTSRIIVDKGVRLTVNDACVPIKLYHGHAASLFDRVDYLFAPRLISMDGEHIYCPKFLGLPDMLRSSDPACPPLLSTHFDLRKGFFNQFKGFWEIGRILGAGTGEIIRAYRNGVKEYNRFQDLLQKGLTAEQALQVLSGEKEEGDFHRNISNEWKIAVLGYPYIIYDPYVSQRVIPRLREQGIRVVTQDMVTPEDLARQNKHLDKDLFWTFSAQVLKAAYYYLADSQVKGIIHVTAFGCGPDFIVDKIMEIECKKRQGLSFMTLSIDEHTGEAGFVTRIEAFTDMLEFQGVV